MNTNEAKTILTVCCVDEWLKRNRFPNRLFFAGEMRIVE